MNNVEFVQSFVLHSRPFKESSLILELLTLDHGRCSVLARGVRGSKKNQKRALLQPFQPLVISWVGRSDLKTLKALEATAPSYSLMGIPSLSGLYMNELMIKLLIQWDPHPDIFDAYKRSLVRLSNKENPSVVLREFELELIDELGYGIDWQYDIDGEALDDNLDYGFLPEQGFAIIAKAPKEALKASGKHIKAIGKRDWELSGSLALARKLCRTIIDPLVGFKELNSRKLLQQTLAIQS
ncbi:DNA repair protein RecO [Kangiella marina]|uniref:DNA repair protein RecO n=1 Tax=Kangiella marina TaxID=1079178 RepID=A0ABP8IN87_9GAMM